MPCCCWPCPWKFSPETTATFPKPICGYSSPSASSFSPTFSSGWRAASAVRVFFLRNLLFLLLSIPYLNLVDWFSLELARGWAMLIGLTPLLRGFLALYIIVAWLARNRFNQLLAAYLFSVLVFTYLASLVFYDYEILVNPRLTDYGDARGGPG